MAETTHDREMAERRRLYEKQLGDLVKATDFARLISAKSAGKPGVGGVWLASRLHAKLCLHATSIIHLASAPLFDHHVMLSLSRMIIDSSVLYFYLVEKVSDDIFNCRYLVLRLHDTVNRIKLLRLGDKESNLYTELLKGKSELVAEIGENSHFNSLEERERRVILAGERIFVGGMHAVARQVMGWNKVHFLGIYSYLSAHVHSLPMSFFRYEQHNIDFLKPGAAQFAAASMAMCYAECGVVQTSIHLLETAPEVEADIPPDLLQLYRSEAARWRERLAKKKL